MLDTTDLPIKSIAERLHYDNPSYMCRIFRRITGQSPVEFRNRHRNP
ncbi:MAG: AraC family transcriptional regulator [Muribaculaceae bacterium]|nr:AraC family transcriptional regulator [Muribaculaceae bacterium]